jgi:hypothetical protein
MSDAAKDPGGADMVVAGRFTVEPAPAWVERSRVRNSRRQDGAPVTCLLSDRRTHVPAATRYTRLVRRLETPQAVQQLSRVEIPFDPEIQCLSVHAVAVFRAGELRNHAEVAAFEFLRREARMEAGIINGEITAVMILRDVRPGDILDIEFSVRDTGGLYQGKSWLVETTAGADAVGDWRVAWVDDATSVPAVAGQSEALHFQERAAGEWTLREWTASDLRGEEPEPGLPPGIPPYPMLQISSFRHWGEVVSPLLSRWRFQPMDRGALDAELRDIRQRGGDDPEKLLDEAVAVARGAVRYQNYSPGLLSIVPADLSTVWERRYGDCKEKSLLLTWLLRELGFQADPVLVGTGLQAGVRSFLPCPGAFDHVVTRAVVGGRTLWIDPTDLYRGGSPASWTSLPYGCGLPLVEGAADLVDIPREPAGRTWMKVLEHIELDPETRDARLSVELRSAGARADWVRGLVDAQGLSGLRKMMKAFMETTRRNIEIESEPDFRDDIGANQCTVRVAARIPGALQRDGRQGVDFIGIAPFGFAGLLASCPAKKRRHPLALTHPEKVEHEMHVRHPGLKKADYPRQSVAHEAFDFACGSRLEQGLPVYWFRYESAAARVEPAELPGYLSAVEKVFKALDICLQLPVTVKSRFRASDPERRWSR